MMRFFSAFIRGQLGYISAHVIAICLFLFYYFVIPDYWFLCTLLTIVTGGAISIYRATKNKKKH
ncbi:hypothetical protein FJP62_10530 [Pantoea vagans]|nr:hypothetical protein CKF42_15845 [Pantoea sp. ARC270]TPE15828.1 hypothetical protein FJP62_10530 [Pantoea vagans]